ncbi:MAG: hypothetical protein U0353_05735 [Sandaracinus sp.]
MTATVASDLPYNAQYATDTESRVIVGVAVTNGLGSKRDGAIAEQDERSVSRTCGRASTWWTQASELEAITTMEQRGGACTRQ